MWLPWVRLHCGKDYLDLAKIFADTPGVRHTINLVPSLLAQVDDIAAGMKDPLFDCLVRPAWDLSSDQQSTLVEYASAMTPMLAQSLPRLEALVRRCLNGTWSTFTQQDWTDLQVTLVLAWTGPVTRRTDPFCRLMLKGALFTDAHRMEALSAYTALASDLVPLHGDLQSRGLVELSTTPFDHPILPLLISTASARDAQPFAPLPQPSIERRADAVSQIELAIQDMDRRFNARPRGMWPAEGSISMEALNMMAAHGIEWTASDEGVLKASLGPDATHDSHLVPWQVDTPNGRIIVLFRDRELSDAIGFRYATWEVDRAVADFVRLLEDRRRRIVSTYGDGALQTASVNIFLDGENCWEFYPGNGEAFLRALLRRLESDPSFDCIPCGEAACGPGVVPWPLVTIRPGSWIDASFDVWIGTPAKNKAWQIVGHCGTCLDSFQGDRSRVEQLMPTYRAMLASDTFWWLDDRHHAPHKNQFELLFRQRAASIMDGLGEEPLFDLTIPLTEETMTEGRIQPSTENAAMHRSDVLVESLGLETNDAWQRLTIRFRRWPSAGEQVTLDIVDADGIRRACQIASKEEIQWAPALHDEGCAIHDAMTIALYMHTSVWWNVDITEDVGSVFHSSAVLRTDFGQP